MPTTRKTPAKKAAAKKASGPKKVTPVKDKKVLREDYLEAAVVLSGKGTYLVTMEDPQVDVHDVWFIPEGTGSLTNKGIRHLAEGVDIVAALNQIGPLVRDEMGEVTITETDDDDVAAEAPPKKAVAKKAAPRRRPAAKK